MAPPLPDDPAAPLLPTLADVEAAAARIAPFVRRTPTIEWRPRPPLPNLPAGPGGPRIFLKLEQLQLGGSFKLRGALSALLRSEARRPVFTASGGNHGIGVTIAARERGLQATVHLPETAPRPSEERLLSLGARVRRGGASWDDAWARCVAEAEAEPGGGQLVHPFDDVAVIAGQGTVGLELLADVPELDLALLGVGGGGLLGGVATVLRARGRAQVLGVQAEGAPAMARSLEAGRLVRLDAVKTIATTLAPRAVSERTLQLCRTLCAGVSLVSDDEIRAAQALLYDDLRLVVEPAGAAALAALCSGRVDPGLLQGARTIGLVLCGANG